MKHESVKWQQANGERFDEYLSEIIIATVLPFSKRAWPSMRAHHALREAMSKIYRDKRYCEDDIDFGRCL